MRLSCLLNRGGSAVLETLKDELERFGTAHDAATGRERRMFNITRDTGEFLLVLLSAARAQRILEIGTSNGYSTLWLAEAAIETGGIVTTIESDAEKIGMARANFARSGLSEYIRSMHEDAGAYLDASSNDTVDAVFLDCDRSRYATWWPHLARLLRPGGVMVVDNATSHASELDVLVESVKADPRFISCLVPVGKGQFMAVKARTRRSALASPVRPQRSLPSDT